MSRAAEIVDLRRIQLEIFGPRDPLELHRFRRTRRWLQRLKYPWDAATITGLAAGLWALALFGTQVIIWSNGSLLVGAIGVLTVGVAGSTAAHLVVDRS
ncbi:MAG TPA: hypothetical protein VGX00_04360 [Thermoplasmata archaeon]|nr:hypothetical protein [Thermoplasmata archaeon]